MKSFLIFLLSFYILSAACNFKYKPHELTITPEMVKMVYGREMSQALLDSIVTVLNAEGIKVTHENPKYDGRLLSQLTIIVEYDGQTAKAQTHFVNRGFDFGFVVNKKRRLLLVGDLKR